LFFAAASAVDWCFYSYDLRLIMSSSGLNALLICS